MKKTIERAVLTGERALFFGADLDLKDCVFCDGESPLKHSKNVTLTDCSFRWKYPLWYSENIVLDKCDFQETARAGVWYTKNISVGNSLIAAPKTFRRAEEIALKSVQMPNASETLWNCKNVRADTVFAKGDYFAMNVEDFSATGLELLGNYSFDGAKNVTIENSRLLSKDAFWNSENVTVKNSYIAGEYIGWNAKNLTLEDCTIESLQGFCYIENLKLVRCKLLNTTLAFEYSTVDAEIIGHIDSVKNPRAGRLTAGSIGDLILEPERVDPDATEILLGEGAPYAV